MSQNNRKINILVTAAGSALGQGIIKCIKASPLNCRIVACDAQPYAAGLYRAQAAYLVPLAKDASFIDQIIRICRQEAIDLVMIGTDYELLSFAECRERIEHETQAKVLVSSPEVIRIADDKWLTYKFLAEHDFPAIPSALPEDVDMLIEKEGFPLIIKPRIGDSSKDTFVVHNRKELEETLAPLLRRGDINQYLAKQSGFLIQKYVGTAEQEYTSTTIIFKGKCHGVLSMQREMKYGGHTTKAIVDDFSAINDEIQKVAEALPAFGPCNFQSRLVNNKIFIFEINCRFSGTTASCAQVGFNTVEAAIRKVVLGEDIPPMSHRKGVILRYFNEIFVPEHDIRSLQEQKWIAEPSSEVNFHF